MKLSWTIILIQMIFTAADSQINKQVRSSPRKESNDIQFPFQVLLRSDVEDVCSGAILSNHWILTSAICLHNKSIKTIWHYIGQQLLYGYQVQMKNIIKHESFDLLTKKNNIALLNLYEKTIFSNEIQPIRMPPNWLIDEYNIENSQLSVSWWSRSGVS